MDKQFDVVVYHESCSDGIASMWSVRRHLPNIQVESCKAGCVYKMDFDIFVNKRIIFVDICPKMDTLYAISAIAKWVTILDHHKSSIDNYENYHDNKKSCLGQIHNNIEIYFDITRAGCQMTWDYFNVSISPNKTRPWFLNYIADRDLWKWELEYSKEYNTAFYDLKYLTADNINLLYEMSDKKKEELKEYGISAVTKFNNKINECCMESNIATVDKYKCWILSCDYAYRSDVGNKMSMLPFPDGTMPDFTAIWTRDPKSNDKWISLRNVSDLDLTIVCKIFDDKGGGHPRAAGFTIYDDDLDSVFKTQKTSNLSKYINKQIKK